MGTISKFYTLEAKRLLLESEKIAQFTTHAPTVGGFRERRLREYVRQHVPDRLTISSGFIVHTDPEKKNILGSSSRQIDCLIYDAQQYAPLLRTEDFAAVSPRAVAGLIEIKSKLTFYRNSQLEKWEGTLVDALENIRDGIRVLEAAKVDRRAYWAGIVAYDGALGQLTDALSGDLLAELEIGRLDELPNEICVLDGTWSMFSPLEWSDDPSTNGGVDNMGPTHAYLLEGKKIEPGDSLQLFTTGLDYAYRTDNTGATYLRTAIGYQGQVDNHKFGIDSSTYFKWSREKLGSSDEP